MLKGMTYLVYCGVVHLPESHRGLLSPKSSIGRVDLMVRGIVDECGLYDTIPGGRARELWLEMTPQSFNIRIREGLAVTQLMIFTDGEDSGPPTSDIFAQDAEPLVYGRSGSPLVPQLYKDSLILSLRVPSEDAEDELLVGFEAIATNEVIDLACIGKHDATKFFRPVRALEGSRLTLEKDRFHILSTKERISIPLHLSGEMIPFSHRVGEVRLPSRANLSVEMQVQL